MIRFFIRQYILIFLTLHVFWGQEAFLRFYIFDAKNSDSTDFRFHIDTSGKGSDSYVQCGSGKIFFHSVRMWKDSLFAEVKDFPVYFRMKRNKAGNFSGTWNHRLKPAWTGSVAVIMKNHSKRKENYSTPPQATFEIDFKFKTPLRGLLTFIKPLENGFWASSIESSSGDFGHAEGYMLGDSVFIQSFNGSGLFAIRGTLNQTDGKGIYRSESGSTYSWSARIKTDVSEKRKETSLNFIYPAQEEFISYSKKFRLDHDSLKGRPVVIHVLGSWCHNCRDEVQAMKSFVNKYSKKGIVFIGFMVEKNASPEYMEERIQYIRNRWDLHWPLIWKDSLTVKGSPGRIFQCKDEIPYPTIFIYDAKHLPVYVHFGFSGPGTGAEFENWIKEFDRILQDQLSK